MKFTIRASPNRHARQTCQKCGMLCLQPTKTQGGKGHWTVKLFYLIIVSSKTLGSTYIVFDYFVPNLSTNDFNLQKG